MTFAQSNWRLIISPPSNGAWNMAVDEAILKSFSLNSPLPVLRLYAWEPACLSLGYAQPSTDVDFDRLISRRWQVVRRPTGGRAILHTDEITYAVIAPHNEPRMAGGVLESYQVLSNALLRALDLINTPAEAVSNPEAQSASDSADPICFEVPSNFEITVNGKKLIGSAQARKKEGVLQHGTLPLFGDLTRITRVLNYQDEEKRQQAAERLLSHAITVEVALGKRISWEDAAQGFIEGFQESLNISLIPSELSEDELDLAESLVREKYRDDDWTLKT